MGDISNGVLYMNTLIAIKTGNLELIKEKIETLNIQEKYYTLGISALHLAVRYNQLEIAKLLIKSGAAVNIKTNTNNNILYGIKDGEPLLHIALKYARYEMLSLLIESEIDLSLRDKDGKTALMLSIELDNSKCTNTLLENEAATFQTTDEMTKFVVSLIKKKDYELISKLFSSGMDIYNKFKGEYDFFEKTESLFSLALKNVDIALVKLLISFNLDINLYTKEIEDWIYSSFPRNKRLDVSSKLNADHDSKDDTYKNFKEENSINPNYFELVGLMLKAGFNLNSLFRRAIKKDDLEFFTDFLLKNIDKLTLPIINEIIILKNQKFIDLTIDYLLSKGDLDQMIEEMINLGEIDETNGLMSSWKILLHAIKSSNVRLINIIIDKLESDGKAKDVFTEMIKTNPEIEKNSGSKVSILEHCIEHSLYRVLELLLKNGAMEEINGLMSWSKILLHTIKSSDVRLINIIIDKLESDNKAKDVFTEMIKTNPKIEKNLWNKVSILEHCIEHSLYRVLELLLKNGAEVNSCFDSDSYHAKYEITKIPLFLAIEKGYLESVKLLVAYDADINQCLELAETHRSNSGGTVVDKLYYLTPLSFALELGSTEIAKLLIKSGADINFTKSWNWYPHQTAGLHSGILASPVEQIIKKNNIELLDLIYREAKEEIDYSSIEKIEKIIYEAHDPEFQRQLLADHDGKDEISDRLHIGETGISDETY